jgi:septal ring factor EnvC (AmiA/AmiB activator)
MNQTDFLKKKHSPNTNKNVKRKLNFNSNKFIKFIIILFLTLCVVFAASFYFSYLGLKKDRALNKDANAVIKEQKEEIARLNTLVEEKDLEIDDLNVELKMYKKQVEELKKQPGYASEIMEELNKLPKDRVHVVEKPVEQTNPDEVEGNMSTVQDDLYINSTN